LLFVAVEQKHPARKKGKELVDRSLFYVSANRLLALNTQQPKVMLPIETNNYDGEVGKVSQASPSSVPTLPLKSPQQSAHPPTSPPPPLPYRPTSSTGSVTTPSDASHSSNGSGKSKGNMVVSSYSTLAAQSIGQGKYRQAYGYYQLALQDYLKDRATVVELVNAAATCFNLGALAKKTPRV